MLICSKCGVSIPDGSVYCNRCGKKQVTQKRKTAKRSHGSGTIHKLPGKRAKPYQARLSNKQRTSIGCYKTVAEAEAALIDANHKRTPEVFALTLKDVWESFEKSEYFAQLSTGTQNKHRTNWKRLERCQNIKVSQLSTAHFQAIVNEMRESGLKRASLEKFRNLCSLLCQEAQRFGAMPINYGSLLQLPESDAEERIPFSNAQVKKIWKVWQDEHDPTAGTIILLCYTGLRTNELKEIDRHDGYFITGSKTEKGRDRIIPYPKFVEPILDAVDFKKFNLSNWRRRKFDPLMERLHIEGRVPYSTRHTYADLQKRRKIDPEIMKDIMGHEDYATTVEHYHHITEDDIDRIKSAVDGMETPDFL